MLALCIQIGRILRHVFDIPSTFATFGRQLKCLLVRIQGSLYLFHYILGHLNWLLFVFLSNLIINLMYDIKKLYFNPNLYGGGICPKAVFCYSSKTVGARLLKLCDFYCLPITNHLVYFLVTRDLSCCHGNPVFNRGLAKK